MNNKRSLARWIRGLATVAAIAAGGQLAHGQHEIPPLPPQQRMEHLIVFDTRQMQAIERAGEALVKELGPGFTITVTKSSACAASACDGAAASSCEVAAAVPSNVSLFNASVGRFVKQGCPCVATGDCRCADVCHCSAAANCAAECALAKSCAGEAVCGSDCLAACEAGACTGKVCGAQVCGAQVCNGQACEATCGSEACDVALAHAEEGACEAAERHHRIRIHHEQIDLAHCLVDLVADRAAARAELESRKEASAKIAALYETCAELIAANAALEAKLEAQLAHAKTLEKVAELAAENARLKAHVELAAGRTDGMQQMIGLTLENERLKHRVAQLEQAVSAGEAARTAERTEHGRTAR